MATAGQIESSLWGAYDFVVVELAAGDDFLGVGLCSADAVLFFLERIERDGFVVGGLEYLDTLATSAPKPSSAER